jgi:V/A-type H+-transporting ATPase subunit F
MARIIALGPTSEVMPYLAMGAELQPAADAAAVGRALAELSHNPAVALVIVPEDLAAGAAAQVAEFRTRSGAALLVLPAATGSQGRALAEMKSFLEHAIGVDLIGKG